MTFNTPTFATITQKCREHNARLVAVSKYRDIDTIRDALTAGVTDLGESKLQVAQQKKELLSDYRFRLHMIGHLQRNKVKDAIHIFDMIQSVDSERILIKIDEQCARAGKCMPILIQLNMTGEDQKHGFRESELNKIIQMAQKMEHVDLQGLMCMGALGNPRESKKIYNRLKQHCDHHGLKECSMGMSDDYELALDAGATMIRIGSLLCE